jgi:nicotinate-nucleotide pyrophosphorylase (carboxylating)
MASSDNQAAPAPTCRPVNARPPHDHLPTLPPGIADDVRRALAEDVGTGDRTAGLIPADAAARAQVISRDHAVLCGAAWFNEAFRQVDDRVSIRWRHGDGDRVAAGDTLCDIDGPARAILTAERTALNFLQTLSGTATRARRYAEIVRGTGAAVLDTRKTIPGLRLAQKYATACGGCENHRLGLHDGILIKENHIAAAGSIAAALRAAQAAAAPGMLVEIEVEDLAQLRAALDAGANRVLLDNFALDQLAAAVRQTAGRAKLEASGGISLENLRAVAETGVDYISIGDITKNVVAVDLSLRIDAD